MAKQDINKELETRLNDLEHLDPLAYNLLHPIFQEIHDLILNNYPPEQTQRVLFHLKDGLSSLKEFLEVNKKNRSKAQDILRYAKDIVQEELRLFIWNY